MIIFRFFFYFSLFTFPNFANAEVFQELSCFDKEKKTFVDCRSGKVIDQQTLFSNYKKIKKGRIIENIKYKYPYCQKLDESISDAYRLPAMDRDDKFIEELLKDIKQLKGRGLNEILNEIYDYSVDFKMINDKDPVGWKINIGGAIPRGTIINYLQEEKNKLSNTTPTKPKPVPEGVRTLKHGYLITAKIGIEFPDGWLVGDNNGEFGGHLVFIRNNKTFQVLLHDNIYGIYNSPIGWIAISGMSHMTTNKGLIYTISNKDGRWAAQEYANLYAAPDDHFQLKDESILISNDWGAFNLTKSGLCRLVKEPK